jgi:hypothetical protein
VFEIFATLSTGGAVVLSDYLLSDSHLYYKIASDAFTTASGSDFAARFPEGFVIQPGQYVVVALANASGGLLSFEAAYGKKPDFELRPTANGATDDPEVRTCSRRRRVSSIGATATLTDGGEPVVPFTTKGARRLGHRLRVLRRVERFQPGGRQDGHRRVGLVLRGRHRMRPAPGSPRRPRAASPHLMRIRRIG